MSFAVALIAAIATLNPLRLWPGLPGTDRRERIELAAGGGLLVVAVLLAVMTFAGPLLDALDISDPTARIAAGAAVVIIGVRDAFVGPAQAEPALPGWRAALVPVAVPHLFVPGLALLAVSASADLGVGVALTVVVLAIGVVVATSVQPGPRGVTARLCRAGQVLTAGAAVAIGAALMLDGVLDI